MLRVAGAVGPRSVAALWEVFEGIGERVADVELDLVDVAHGSQLLDRIVAALQRRLDAPATSRLTVLRRTA